MIDSCSMIAFDETEIPLLTQLKFRSREGYPSHYVARATYPISQDVKKSMRSSSDIQLLLTIPYSFVRDINYSPILFNVELVVIRAICSISYMQQDSRPWRTRRGAAGPMVGRVLAPIRDSRGRQRTSFVYSEASILAIIVG